MRIDDFMIITDEAHIGKTVSLFGRTQIRAGVTRPQIIISQAVILLSSPQSS